MIHANRVSRLALWVTICMVAWCVQCSGPSSPSVALDSGVRVWLDQPPNGAALPLGAFPLKAHARDSAGGGVDRVVFLVNTIPLGTINTDAAQPLVSAEWGWNPSVTGEYRIQAQAFGRNGSALSEQVVVCVGPNCPNANPVITPTVISPAQPIACKGTPVISSFTVLPANVSAGGAATLSWSTSNADIIEITGIGPVGPSGSRGVTVNGTTTLILYAMCGGKETLVEKSVTIMVAGAPQQTACSGKPVITTFAASPSSITVGASSTLKWAVTNADRVEIIGVGQVELAGSRAVAPKTTTKYTLDAFCGGKETVVEQSLSVTVAAAAAPATRTPTPKPAQPPPPPAQPQGCSGAPNIASLSASPSTISQGGSSTLSWGAVTNADSVSIDQGIGGVGTPWPTSVSPGGTTTYTLTARCGSNTVTRQAIVTVQSAPQPPPSDKTPPTISYVKPSASAVYYNSGCTPNTLTIAAGVSDPAGLASVLVYYRYIPQKGSASGWIPVNMSSIGGSDYSANVPYSGEAYKALSGGNGTIEFYVGASDKLGNSGTSGTSAVSVVICPG